MKGSAVISCLYLICPFLGANDNKITYTGNQLWKITNDNKTTLNILTALEDEDYLSVWGHDGTTVDAMVNAKSIDKIIGKLLENNLQYEVTIPDIQNAIDEENPEIEDERNDKQGHQLTWLRYHRLEDIYGYLHYLELTFPRLCTLYTIGRSVEGRPIKLLKISNRNPNNKAIFIEGGIHAREWISPSAVTYMIHQFIYNYDNEPPSIRNLDWYIVPVLNPDGYEYSHTVERLWRKNRAKFGQCVGVDLNRNWGYQWVSNGSSDNSCQNHYRGPKPFSEPETAAIANLFLNNRNINWKSFISIHSYGQYIVYPWGSTNAVLEDFEELDKIATKASLAIISAGGVSYTVGPAGITIYSASGTSIDWAKGAQAVKYTYTIELRDTGRYGFLLPSKLIRPTSEEALIVVRTIAEAAADA